MIFLEPAGKIFLCFYSFEALKEFSTYKNRKNITTKILAPDIGSDVLIIRNCGGSFQSEGGQCVSARPSLCDLPGAMLSWPLALLGNLRSCRGHGTWVGSIFELHPGSLLVFTE